MIVHLGSFENNNKSLLLRSSVTVRPAGLLPLLPEPKGTWAKVRFKTPATPLPVDGSDCGGESLREPDWAGLGSAS